MREKLIDLLGETVADCMPAECLYDIADHLIANGVTIQKHGHWVIKNIKNSDYKYCFCSECLTIGSNRWKICPVCETKMDGGEQE